MTARPTWAGKSAATVANLLLPTLLGLLIGAVLAPVLYLGSTDVRGRQFSEDAEPGYQPLTAETPRQRVAVLALHRANLASITIPQEADGLPPRRPGWLSVEGSQLEQCSNRNPLVMSIAAVEIYARPAWRRSLETGLARLIHDISGKLPDWSYGIGQIRISTARKAITGALTQTEMLGRNVSGLGDLTDIEIFNRLTTPCDNIAMMRLVLNDIEEPGDTIPELAEKYRGGPETGLVAGAFSYSGLTWQVADFLSQLSESAYEPYSIPAFDEPWRTGHAATPVEVRPLPMDTAEPPTLIGCLKYGALETVFFADRNDFEESPYGYTDSAAISAAIAALDPTGFDLRALAPRVSDTITSPLFRLADDVDWLADLNTFRDEYGPWRSVTHVESAIDEYACAEVRLSPSPWPFYDALSGRSADNPPPIPDD